MQVFLLNLFKIKIRYFLLIIQFFFVAAYCDVDFIIFTYNRPMQLYALLESVEKYVCGIGKIYVISRASSESYKSAYANVQNRFDSVKIIFQNKPPFDFKNITNSIINEASSRYILFAVDDNIVKDYFDLNYCVSLMDKEGVYGFYLRMGMNITMRDNPFIPEPWPPFQKIQDVLIWSFFEGGFHDWAYPNNVDMTIYRKSDIENTFIKLDFFSPNSLEAAWHKLSTGIYMLKGMCFGESKIINIPLNQVQTFCKVPHMNSFSTDQLLDLYNKGKKIDIFEFHKIKNETAHVYLPVHFIDR